MAGQTEGQLSLACVKRLNRIEGIYAVKIHGGPHQRKGLPDIIGLAGGYFFGIEMKLPGKESTLTELQAATLRDIERAGGIAFMATSERQVLQGVMEGYAGKSKAGKTRTKGTL